MNESEELRDHALRILAAGLAGVDPERVVVEALADEPILSEWSHAIAGTAPATPLGGGTSADGRTRVVAVGKAAAGMLRGALRVLGDAVDEGVLLMPGSRTTERPSWLPPGIRVHAAGHPLPDEGGVAGARDILRVVEGRGLRDRLLVLISGGGSALLTLPAPGLTLEQLRETTRILLQAGVPIREMNAVRARLEVLKGGGLARAAHPSRVLAYLISDVVGDDPAVIASGPLTPPGGSVRRVESELRRRGVWAQLPGEVRRRLAEAGIPEARAGAGGGWEAVSGWEPVVRIVGSGSRAVEAAAVRARDLGYRTHILSRKLEGEARNAGRALARVGMAVQDGVAGPAPPACILASGETTVRVTGSGLGGRNQEVALGAALALEERSGIVVASLGTDGVDGPTDAAGGLADGSSVERARAMGRSVADALERNDAYPVLDALGDLVRTGVTGTNVADLMVVLVRPS